MRAKRGCEWHRFDQKKMEVIKQHKEGNDLKNDCYNDDGYSSYGGYYSDLEQLLE